MTLYINVLATESFPEGGTLIVEGSRAGLLACQNVGANTNLSPPFHIKCASDDMLYFKLAKNLQQYERGNIMAVGDLHANTMAKRIRNQVLYSNVRSNLMGEGSMRGSTIPQTNLAMDNQPFRSSQQHQHPLIEHHIEMKGPNKIGYLRSTIAYDPVSHFQGEFCSAKKNMVELRQKVALFKGKCPTKNLFSILDPACDNQQTKFIESIYRDGQVMYREEY